MGVDAIVEQKIDGKHSGKFLAVQIKTGKSHFHISEKKLSPFVTNIHYNYWLNLNIPIILVAHFLNEETYWISIEDSNFRKTKTKWALDIPKKSKLNSKSITRLTKLFNIDLENSFIHSIFYKDIKPESIFDWSVDVECIDDSRNCVDNIKNTMHEMSLKNRAINEKLLEYFNSGLSDKSCDFKGCEEKLKIGIQTNDFRI